MELTEVKLNSEEVYAGVVFRVTKDAVRLPDGRSGRRDLVHTLGGVVVLPVDGDGCVTLVRQFRYAHGEALLEAVAGKLEAGEEPFFAAQRELREETGFTAKKWTPLGMIQTSPGFLTEKLWLFLAEELTQGEQELDDGEFLNLERYPFAEAAAMAADGRMNDAKTLAILLRAGAALRKEAEHGETDSCGR